MHLDINKTLCIDFDPFIIILTLISIANAYIVKYLLSPQQACGNAGFLSGEVEMQ